MLDREPTPTLTQTTLPPTELEALTLLYADRIGPLHLGDLKQAPAGLAHYLRQVETPLGPLFALSAAGRRYLGYKNPWKPVSVRFVARRFATRRLIESLARERHLFFEQKLRGSVLLRDVEAGERLLVAAFLAAPSKPSLLGLFRKSRELGARGIVAYDRPKGGRPFNLIRSGALELRRLRDLPELPALTLDLVRAPR